MNDLLAAVKGPAAEDPLAGNNGVGRYKPGDNVPGDIELGGPATSEEAAGDTTVDAAMQEFYAEVASVKDLLASMQRMLKSLQSSHAESQTVTKAERMKEIRAKMDADITDVGRMAKDAKERLERVEKANEEARYRKGHGPGSSHDRTRSSITNGLSKKLRDILSKYQDLRGQIQSEYREVVERRLYAVTGQKADEELLERMIETGESEEIFKTAVQEAGRGQILDTIAEIQERYDAVREIERKLLELHQIFLDMAVLVEAQGEMLDNIENQVGQAVEYTASGNVMLTDAKRIQKNTRKWMCCAIWMFMVIVCIIVVAVIKPWEGGDA